jgi:hypothetical protein
MAINRWVNNTIAVKGVKSLAHFSADGPVRIILWVIKPFWQMSGVTIYGSGGMENRLLKKFHSNFFSIGITAVFSIGFLLLLLIL